MMKTLVWAVALLSLLLPICPMVFAVDTTGIPAFSASCHDKTVWAYRYGVDVEGIPIRGDKWSTGEHFPDVWRFTYAGGNQVVIDGKPWPILVRNGPVLVIASPEEALLGASIWTYVIHLGLRMITAAQVHGDVSLTSGIKNRSVELACDFEVNK